MLFCSSSTRSLIRSNGPLSQSSEDACCVGEDPRKRNFISGAPDRIRTCDFLLRRQALYPAELRVRRTRWMSLTVCNPNSIPIQSCADYPTFCLILQCVYLLLTKQFRFSLLKRYLESLELSLWLRKPQPEVLTIAVMPRLGCVTRRYIKGD